MGVFTTAWVSSPWPVVAVVVTLVAAPVPVPLAMPEEIRERFLEVRHRDTRELVTVVEVLSPTNKRAGSEGRREYLRKRDLAPTTELFIERAGTQSSASGKPYQVRCGNAAPVPSQQWFGQQLKVLRR